jgi:lipooligosaccharide transport system permease protein
VHVVYLAALFALFWLWSRRITAKRLNK